MCRSLAVTFLVLCTVSAAEVDVCSTTNSCNSSASSHDALAADDSISLLQSKADIHSHRGTSVDDDWCWKYRCNADVCGGRVAKQRASPVMENWNPKRQLQPKLAESLKLHAGGPCSMDPGACDEDDTTKAGITKVTDADTCEKHLKESDWSKMWKELVVQHAARQRGRMWSQVGTAGSTPKCCMEKYMKGPQETTYFRILTDEAVSPDVLFDVCASCVSA